MQDSKTQELKEFLKTVSLMINELASSLALYVEDETDPAAKKAFKEQIAFARKMSDSMDETILDIALNR